MILPIMMAVVVVVIVVVMVVVVVVVVVVPIMMTYSFIGNLPVLYVHDLTTRFQLSFIETSALDSTNVEQVSTAAAAAAAAAAASSSSSGGSSIDPH
jgi:predicted PurR-regulated permease PerM